MIALYRVHQAEFTKKQESIKKKAKLKPQDINLGDLKFYMLSNNTFRDNIVSNMYVQGAFFDKPESKKSDERFELLKAQETKKYLENGSTKEGLEFWNMDKII